MGPVGQDQEKPEPTHHGTVSWAALEALGTARVLQVASNRKTLLRERRNKFSIVHW